MASSFTNNLINNSIYHLLNFEKYTSFQMAAREAAINNSFQIVLFTEEFNTVFSVETRHTTSIEGTVSYWLSQNPDKDAKSTKLDYDGVTTYWGPITIGGSKYYLMLVDNDQNYNKEEITKLAEIIELAMGMWNYLPERDTAAEMLRALRRGNRGLADTMLEELDIKAQNFLAAFFVPGIEKNASLGILAAFETAHSVRSIRINEGAELVGAFVKMPGCGGLKLEDYQQLASEFVNAGAHAFYYVSQMEGIDGMANAFQLINESEAFASLIYPRKTCYSEFEMALAATCIHICMSGGTSKKYYSDILRGFKQAKEQKSRQLQETLEVYILDSGLSVAKTAEILDVHVNTVQYRLKRIREILGVDIADSAVVTSLMLALAISRLSKEVKSF